jgi:regulator of ribonuclease activity A
MIEDKSGIDISGTKTLVCDIMDHYSSDVRLFDPIFHDFGGKTSFHGVVSTITCFEDNSKVFEAVGEQGDNRILVIDGQGSLRYSLFGGNLAQKAYENGWAGVIVNGGIRDVAEQREILLGVKALGVCPRRTIKRNEGERDVAVTIAGQTILPHQYIYADEDGIIISDIKLHN